MTVDCVEIRAGGGLDTITVFWRNWEAGKGEITVHCYGSAWTAYFGAMSGLTIQQFVAGADVGYLVNKLTDVRFQKRIKSHEKYLARIVEAVKSSVATERVLAEEGE